MRVLLFEDDAEVLALLIKLIDRSGHTSVLGRLDAQAEAQLRAETYDAVVTDIQMPRLSGAQVLHWANAYRPGTPVIGISGSGVLELARHGVTAADFAAFLYKPFPPAALLQAIEQSVGAR